MPALSQRLLKISMWFSQAKEKLGQHQKLLLILSLFILLHYKVYSETLQ